MKRNITRGFAMIVACFFLAQAITTHGQQMADPAFDAKVAHPAYTKKHPKVLFDEAHSNFHTTDGRYKPFASLITSDGYRVTPNKEKFQKPTLKGYDILVIANALGADKDLGIAAKESAFKDEECDAVRDWVRAGGSLLLIADHAPMGAAAENLGKRFGVEMSKGYTGDTENNDKESGNQGFIIYTRESGRLADHPITRGRNESERINRIIAFTGQSLKGPSGSVAIMKLADTAIDHFPKPGNNQEEASVSAAGRAQGIIIKFGKGRVVILGEAAMLSAQVIKRPNQPDILFGMNRAGIDNRQFALNVMHWLSGLL
jgi:hypothetical protein